MINENDLDDMFLPKANSNEELETISEQKLQPLFNPTLFELCTRDRRDKGIDLTYEIKRKNNHLGFRFIIQLKATESIQQNIDKSYSKSIETSNINALLNNSYPAYYILYIKKEDVFYYASVLDFIKSLDNKDKNWQKQQSHTLRFDQKLSESDVSLIYSDTLNFGLFQRNLKTDAIAISTSMYKADRISIDSDFNITDDSKIREMIENMGFTLINQASWDKILLVHKNATGNVATTSLYNLILGIANYYGGNRWHALSFLKMATNLKSDLNDEMQMCLAYFDATVRFSCGLIADDEYKSITLKLGTSKTVGLYIKLREAKEKYIKSPSDNLEEDFLSYENEIEGIIKHPDASNGLILTAKCELLLYQGFNRNFLCFKKINILNIKELSGQLDIKERMESADEMKKLNDLWYKNVQHLIDETQTIGNNFAYYTALINEALISYQFTVIITLITLQKKKHGFIVYEKPESDEKIFERKLKKLSEAIDFFTQIEHIENIVVTYFTIFEILHYLQRIDAVNKLANYLDELIDKYDLQDYKKKLESLRNGGTTHELFQEHLNNTFKYSNEKIEQFHRIRNEMIQMDEKEKKNNKELLPNRLRITLFPIGDFYFPESKKDKVYEILNINSVEVQEKFNAMFKLVIPIANIFINPIESEGPLQGNFEDKGMESWENIYRIRKAFYENKFYRV